MSHRLPILHGFLDERSEHLRVAVLYVTASKLQELFRQQPWYVRLWHRLRGCPVFLPVDTEPFTWRKVICEECGQLWRGKAWVGYYGEDWERIK